MYNPEKSIKKSTADFEDFEYEVDESVDPKELSGNANLALHHHMAPPDGHDEDED